MKNNIYILAALLIIATSSCEVSHFTTNANNYASVSFKHPQTIIKPLVADLEVSQVKISKNYTFRNMTITDAKEEAMAAFCKDNNCDAVVQPLYNIESVSSSSSGTTNNVLTVSYTGYPANYKNIHTYEQKDSVNFLKNTHVDVAAPAEENNKILDKLMPNSPKKKRVGLILLAVFGGILALTLLSKAL